jgi:hypothetical protein
MRLRHEIDQRVDDKALPQRTTAFSSNDSKLDCLRESSVSFFAPTGIDPVGAGQYPNSEMPP